MSQKYVINENGEIIRGDYFFTHVTTQRPQPLQCNRKAWAVVLLNFFTFGIYGILVMFAMGKETNITCEYDGKHTKSFWPTIGLTIITLGIYGIVWLIRWLKRESDFLRLRKASVIITGTGYIILTAISVIIQFYMNNRIGRIFHTYGASIGWIITSLLIVLVIKQHNQVNEIYNLEHFPSNLKTITK